MGEAKHTRDTRYDRSTGRIETEDGLVVGLTALDAAKTIEEMDANGYLFAAAPDLLEAAEAVATYQAETNARMPRDVLAKLRAAIAKTKGE